MKGYHGKWLRVNLTTGTFKVEEPPEEDYRRYIGGRGFIIPTLLKEVPIGIDAFDPENRLIFALGPITGHPLIGSGRNSVGAKSPLTGGFGESEAGGFWGAELKKSGFDVIIIEGKSDKPVYLSINDGSVEIRDANKLWGREVAETEKLIKEDLGDKKICTAAPAPPHPDPLPVGEGTRPAIQLHNSYLVAESDDGLVIIDQHALHERIMFEDLKARITRGPLESQHLLIPQSFKAGTRQIALLEQIQPLLARLGIEAGPFGPDSVAVQAFPTFLEKLDPVDFMRELLERGEQELLDLHEEELLHEILDMMACKAAVKAGDPLTAGEIESLLARRDLVERSSNCPHGRPTTLRLSLHDLEKQFKRTGF